MPTDASDLLSSPFGADHGRPEPAQRLTQLALGHGRDALVEIALLGRAQRSRLRRPADDRFGQALDEDDARHRAIAEETIDTLDDDRLEMLRLGREGRGNAEPQRAEGALA